MKIVTKPKIKLDGRRWKCYCNSKSAYGDSPKMAYVNWRTPSFIYF
jgi:hypothetical protein